MIQSIARFAQDSYSILRIPNSTYKKFALCWNLLRPSQKMLGFKISYFDRPTFTYLYREIFARQNYYFRSSHESPVILDAGANLGMATLYFKWLYPKAKMYAFEPDPTTFAMLQTNVAQNHLTDVVLQNCALGQQDGTVELFVNRNNPGTLLMSTFASRLQGEAIRVPSRRLSDFINAPIDFLKLDVEGAEHQVLCDLVSTEKIGLIRQMVVEYHHRLGTQLSCLGGFLDLLEQAGFDYQLHASLRPVTSQNIFQDILIGAYRTTQSNTQDVRIVGRAL
jgi:FkbM family methyltransferase